MTDEGYEVELTGDRDEIAAALDGVADGVREGAIRLGDGTDAVRIDTPDAIELEIELETDDEEVEVELELTWPTPADGSDAVRPAEQASATAQVVSDEPANDAGTDDTDSDVTAADSDEPAADETVTATQPNETAAATPSDDPVTEPATDEAATEADDLADAVGPAASAARFELFCDRADEWRWRLRHHNGNVIATSGEGYTRKHNAKKGLQSVVRNASGAELTEEPTD